MIKLPRKKRNAAPADATIIIEVRVLAEQGRVSCEIYQTGDKQLSRVHVLELMLHATEALAEHAELDAGQNSEAAS
jgi:hypothetical protein